MLWGIWIDKVIEFGWLYGTIRRMNGCFVCESDYLKKPTIREEYMMIRGKWIIKLRLL